jgi:hypothetical protein
MPKTNQSQNLDPRDFSTVLKDAPPGAWVALSHNKTHVVATGDSMRSVTDEAQARGEADPILIKMPLLNGEPGEIR